MLFVCACGYTGFVCCLALTTQATKLYYHVLELVVSSEERIAVAAVKAGGAAALSCSTTLLTSSKLHKGLMACSLEIVMACYK